MDPMLDTSVYNNMKKLTIAIDYDDTFTSDYILWSGFINAARNSGHCVVMVTARRSTDENADLINGDLDAWDCQIPIFFTGLGSKTEHMKSIGITVNIWIDDNPQALVNGH